MEDNSKIQDNDERYEINRIKKEICTWKAVYTKRKLLIRAWNINQKIKIVPLVILS